MQAANYQLFKCKIKIQATHSWDFPGVNIVHFVLFLKPTANLIHIIVRGPSLPQKVTSVGPLWAKIPPAFSA